MAVAGADLIMLEMMADTEHTLILLAAASWIQRGFQAIGGCCCIGVEHIQLLKKIVSE